MLYGRPFIYVNDLFLDPEAQTLQSYTMAPGQSQQDIRLWGVNQDPKDSKESLLFSSVQSLSHVQLFATPWIAAHQASLSITNSQSSLRLTSIESVMPSSHLILGHPLLLLPPIPPTEMQVKSTMRYYLTVVRMALMKKSTNNNAGKGVEKMEHSCTVSRNVNWYSYYGRQYGDSLKKKQLEIKLP